MSQDYFVYLDETGTLDFDSPKTPSDFPYFGVGSATYIGDHSQENWEAQVLRLSLEERGLSVEKQFHAKDDVWPIRDEVFSLISMQKPQFDATFLRKDRAYWYVQNAGKMRLYKLAFFLHLKRLLTRAIPQDAKVYIITATIGTKAIRATARSAIEDIANQMPQVAVPCYWDSRSVWGLQAADYLLWATHRQMMGRSIGNHADDIEALTVSRQLPWGE
ncbi:DUF3800 domain-containing protein [Trueperella pyogenes]|uniref:DUF3800 domain-containing protein n=1 Tax=Trueperella pyogenes TaxID=1661 RepID=UPI0024BFF122|nr:DUF3800 domain-containing protein [Trueperella pyogenes]WHU60192.1 DUF3800 domain-containing protein [Trueperella pyogenes]